MEKMDETNCKWVSSRGILKSCERHNKIPQSSSRHIDPDILDNLKDYDVIHICSWLSITLFIKNFAPKIDKKVIIVTNDSDFDSPIFEKPVGKGDEIAKDEIMNFINSEFCVHWFTQNCTLKHPKVTPIPIGMDYHTFSSREPYFIQELVLNNVKSNSTPFHKRQAKCYGNYHFTMDGKYYSNDRFDCYKSVPKKICFYEDKPVPRNETWENQSRYAFVLSPAGGGLDCHRTWEALILGCIPIVKRFNVPHEEVYDDLPVLIVEKWSDVTQDLLLKTMKEFKNKKFNYDKLTLKYWVDLIYSYKNK